MRNKLALALGLVLLISAPVGTVSARGHHGGWDHGGGHGAPHGPGVPQGQGGHGGHGGQAGEAVEVSLEPTPLAGMNGLELEDASGTALVRVDEGTVVVFVNLGDAMLPEGSVLEGWVVDPGLDGGPGGPGLTSVSDADEMYGTPFGDANIDTLVDDAAYALSTGVLRRLSHGLYQVTFHIDNNLTPYNAVVITLESDGNGENYDPRPGTPVLAGLY